MVSLAVFSLAWLSLPCAITDYRELGLVPSAVGYGICAMIYIHIHTQKRILSNTRLSDYYSTFGFKKLSRRAPCACTITRESLKLAIFDVLL